MLKPTPEGSIVLALASGARSYAKLKQITGLSDRWLSKKLKELTMGGIVERRGGKYALARPELIYNDEVALAHLRSKASPACKARMVAEELGRDWRVLAIVLFGSVAKGAHSEESDIDLLVITDGGVELYDEVYELSFKYLVPLEAIFLSFDDFLMHARLRSTLLFGVMEGYEVLQDRVGIAEVLSYLRRKVEEEFAYDEGAGAWIRRSALTMRQL